MTGHPDYTDQEYLEGIRNAELAVEKTFYRKYYNLVYSLVGAKDSTKTIDPEDLYQDVITVVFTKIKQGELINLTAKLSTYIYRIAYNMLLYQLRQNRRFQKTELGDFEVEDDEAPDYDINAVELQGIELVKKLRYPCNEIIEDWYINKLNYIEIAKKFRYSDEGMARKKKSECLKVIREQARKLLADHLK
jgi:RNA polymerase sigma factor (sigma-70 family)